MSENKKSARPEDGPVFSGGDGSTPEDAVVIEEAGSHVAGVRAEKEYLSRLFGTEGIDWELKIQTLMERDDGTRIDEMTIEKDSGGAETVYFDISNFFGMEP